MTSFVPPEYLTAEQAIIRIAKALFQEQLAAIESEITKNDIDRREAIDKFTDPVRAVLACQPNVLSGALRDQAQKIGTEAVRHLRNELYKGRVTAVYFSSIFGALQEIDASLWATARCDGVLETGFYEPLGMARAANRPYSEPVLIAEGQLASSLRAIKVAEPERNDIAPSRTKQKPGVKPVKRERIKAEIMQIGLSTVMASSDSYKAVQFKAAASTVKAAIDEILNSKKSQDGS